MDAKQRRIRKEVNSWSAFCKIDPEDFDRNDVKTISEAAKVTTKEVWQYLDYWYHM